MTSPFVERMNDVQKGIAVFLKPLGFRGKGRSYNRSQDDGIVQVIGLQMGAYEIGTRQTAPLPPELQHFRRDLYGQFTINLGIFIDEVSEGEHSFLPKGIVPEYRCQIRRRLGRSQVAGKEYWWHLDQPVDRILADIIPMLEQDGLPFLERFSTRKAIIADWVDYNDGGDRLSARARVDVAIMLAKLGNRSGAAGLLREQIGNTSHKGHVAYVLALGQRLGLGDLTHPYHRQLS